MRIEEGGWALAHGGEENACADDGGIKLEKNCGDQVVYDSDEKNYLAKKDDFAKAVENDQVLISNDSWLNFSHIFERIKEIVKLKKKNI